MARLGFLLAGLEVDIGQGVDLVHDDVAVVGSDTGGDTGDTFTLITAGDGVELTRLYVALYTTFVKEGCYHVNTVLVTHEDDLVGQEFRT